jgi:hypothetical protein
MGKKPEFQRSTSLTLSIAANLVSNYVSAF